MARTREFDTEAALDAIVEAFWRDGYEATGIADLVEATGVGRASLYGAFGPKHQMLHAAIDRYLAARIEPMFAPIAAGGIDEVSGLYRRMAMVRREHPKRAQMGCLVVNSVVEMGADDPVVDQLGARYEEIVRNAFRSALERAAAAGETTGDIDAMVDAAWLLLMGMFVSIKSGADATTIDRLAEGAAKVVDSWRR